MLNIIIIIDFVEKCKSPISPYCFQPALPEAGNQLRNILQTERYRDPGESCHWADMVVSKCFLFLGSACSYQNFTVNEHATLGGVVYFFSFEFTKLTTLFKEN